MMADASDIRMAIHQQILQCDSFSFPNINDEIQSEDGYLGIENQVLMMVFREGVSIGTAINSVESELL